MTVFIYENSEINTKQEDSSYELKNNETKILVDCYIPIIINSEMTEGATQEQIDDNISALKLGRYKEIDNKISTLISGSIAIILQLKGLEENVLKSRVELYQLLYNAVVKVTPTQDDIDFYTRKYNLFKESTGLTLSLEDYKNTVVKVKWEQGEIMLNKFKGLIEVVRSKWKLVCTDDVKFNAIKQELNKLNENTNPADIQPIFDVILAI